MSQWNSKLRKWVALPKPPPQICLDDVMTKKEIVEHNARLRAEKEARRAPYRCIAKRGDGRQCKSRRTWCSGYCQRHRHLILSSSQV